MSYVVGVDVGGTSTRALVVTPDGTGAGRGSAGGANPNSHPPEVAAARVAEAIAAAIGPLDPAEAATCVLGMAGASKFSDPVVAGLFDAALRGIGIRCRVTVVSDAEVAFASATEEPDGTVVIGGTGSVAARIVGHRKVSVVGGFGWLLGDEGSAFWIGREAVRSTLRFLQTDEPVGRLAGAVLCEALGIDAGQMTGWAARQSAYARLITSVNTEPPIRLARFAPLVSANAAEPADQAAVDIVDRAAALLAEQAHAARTPGELTPIVLAGSVIGPDSPVGERLRAALRTDPAVPVHFATDAAAGAARLALVGGH